MEEKESITKQEAEYIVLNQGKTYRWNIRITSQHLDEEDIKRLKEIDEKMNETFP